MFWATDPGRVEEFVTQMQAGDRFPPAVVFWDQAGNLWLADVFHRYEAAQRLSDRVTFPCLVYASSRRDAEEHAATCNARHGPPMTRADKQAAIRRLIGLHPDWPDREIGWRVGRSPTTVGSARGASVQFGQMPNQRTVQRGDRTYTYTSSESPQYAEARRIENGVRASERHLYRVVKGCKGYFNHARPHQGIEQRIPCQSEQLGALPVNGKLSSRPVLSALHHDYYWQAAECVGQGTSQLRSHLH